MSERERGDCAATTISLERNFRMRYGGQCGILAAAIDRSEFISVRDAAMRSSMSERSIRKFIRNDALPHYRNCRHGKIWLRWIDFVAWMERRRIELKHDDSLLGILRDMNGAGVARP